jgi:hypothetical protein
LSILVDPRLLQAKLHSVGSIPLEYAVPILFDFVDIVVGDKIKPFNLVEWHTRMTGELEELIVDEVHACITR